MEGHDVLVCKPGDHEGVGAGLIERVSVREKLSADAALPVFIAALALLGGGDRIVVFKRVGCDRQRACSLLTADRAGIKNAALGAAAGLYRNDAGVPAVLVGSGRLRDVGRRTALTAADGLAPLGDQRGAGVGDQSRAGRHIISGAVGIDKLPAEEAPPGVFSHTGEQVGNRQRLDAALRRHGLVGVGGIAQDLLVAAVHQIAAQRDFAGLIADADLGGGAQPDKRHKQRIAAGVADVDLTEGFSAVGFRLAAIIKCRGRHIDRMGLAVDLGQLGQAFDGAVRNKAGVSRQIQAVDAKAGGRCHTQAVCLQLGDAGCGLIGSVFALEADNGIRTEVLRRSRIACRTGLVGQQQLNGHGRLAADGQGNPGKRQNEGQGQRDAQKALDRSFHCLSPQNTEYKRKRHSIFCCACIVHLFSGVVTLMFLK